MSNKFLYFILVTVLLACKPKINGNTSKLSSEELKVCHRVSFDSSIALLIKQYTDSTLKPYTYGKYYGEPPGLPIGDSEDPPGLSFNETHERSEIVMSRLKDTLMRAGYTIFLTQNSFGIEGKPDEISVLRLTSILGVLKVRQTHGLNYNIDNDSLVNIIERFDQKYGLALIGAGDDWCSFKVTKAPKDWMKMANEVYAVCPDVVDQGTDTKEALAEEMKRTRVLYLWWD